MFGFNFGRKIILGIDVGHSALKIVELEERGGNPYLSNYAWMPLLKGKNSNSDPNFFEVTLPEYLKKIIKEAEFKGKEVYASIPSFGALVTLIDFPRMPEKDMEQAIRFEAQKYIPTSLDEVVLNWEIIEKEPLPALESEYGEGRGIEPEGKAKVLLAAVSKKEIMNYEQAIKKAGLKLIGAEIENIAAVHSLIGKDEGNFILVDIGSRVCNIIYAEKGIIMANRNIDAGGADFTRAIASNLGVTEEKAELMKISGKNFFSLEFNINFPALNYIVEEISRILDSISKSKGSFSPDALILSGGTSNLIGITDFFQKKLNIKTIIGNPFGRVKYDKKLEESLKKVKGQLSVCIGLALAGFESKKE